MFRTYRESLDGHWTCLPIIYLKMNPSHYLKKYQNVDTERASIDWKQAEKKKMHFCQLALSILKPNSVSFNVLVYFLKINGFG